ncbi:MULTISPECIES: helix-turn-helix transcriptional regulator [Lacticaseibacillus]|uniref:helix-turn-helix transcriptional regulator n=1 Tax=Lacticaseibacillus TaxID=2759736 RepID=UPI000468830C|nr:helix-turn-helix transcriptional regulator [Lacticaseibacillus casei]HAJ53203.1 transcriptional regulator [Lactobacillus sp.]MBI6597358.1 helix-turn-helix transcriptional regulator [Lacticaseibacillus casei]MBO1481055.1 helix-turn-helix transcriptional regulator [Lacticaseibacillus casei]MBO2416334.1 helix-turn-helix transcriptional regulator [Lacticaseibacillus casei]MCK2080736.1 helix-turn-helix transcriptional regulator [Lacticaseibacillus casei]
MKNRIEALRNQHQLTQQDLADLLDVSRQTVSSLENGRYNPSLGLAFKISRVFDLPIERIFSDERTDRQ